jgi:hypothetical protein
MRSRIAALAAAGILTAACGGTDSAATTTEVPETTTGPAPTAATTTTTTTTLPETTTTATTTTLPQEAQDAMLAAQLWKDYDDAWEEGPEAVARFIVENTYPGMPATYEDCLFEFTPGSRNLIPYRDTVTPDEGWEPAGIDLDVEGRTYTIDVTFRDGTGDDVEEETNTVHVTVRNGEAFFFVSCEPKPPPTTTTTIPADALAYRFEEGAAYTHRVTFRNDITEDQTAAGGSVRAGRETWTHEIRFTVTGFSDAGSPRMEMSFDRVVWEMYSAGVHRNAFDTATDDDPDRWYGYHGDLAGDTRNLTVEPEQPRIGGDTSQSFLTLPAAPIAAGDTWEGEWALGDPRLSGTMTITADEVGDDTVRVSFSGTGDGRRVTEDMISVDLIYETEGSVTGTAVIDAATGWIRTMVIDLNAEGTLQATSGGFWNGIRPLAGSRELQVGPVMPVSYLIHIETTTIDG